MHEMSLVASIIEIIEEYAAKQSFSRVNTISLACGQLACIDKQALEFAFNLQSEGSRAEGAVLNIQFLPARIHCFSCEKTQAVESFPEVCPQCGKAEIMLTGGTEELKILELDVD
ncbi:MAG: hydrogenase maturation nickel metallochaperone HypA [Deltaproteobacteria bacterium]|nr:hydrogenase maturation nickel metallochaperone HypA [Deltaproteobacteria bacterium]